MDSNNFTLIFIITLFSLFFFKFIVLIFKKNYPKLLIDDRLNKPQAFHESPVSVTGGLGIFLSFLIIFFYFFQFKNVIFLQYLTFCSLIFALGFVDDLKINVKAEVRLLLMTIFLVFMVKYNNFYLENTGIEFLNNWLAASKIFSLIFICLCFLFIINGANLIDGYNGLLGIHSLIILINLIIINFVFNNNDLANFLLLEAVVLLIFLMFNFPNAKIFLGDSGSYFLGSFIAISIIETSKANPDISPFYFCILLFYLFFEVFFSFIRKTFKEKKSPVRPDKKHLHMLLYKILLKKNKSKLKSNYTVSIVINLIYLILILPAIFMMKDGMFCKYYSLMFFVLYILLYKKAHEKVA